MPDRRELKAKIVGVDEFTDLALLKIEARGLPVLPWGDSSKLKVAEWVLAIGNPFQLNQTVTLGIVSALGRSLGLANYEDFIQTDAAINPGNSGGALINARGELIGINTAIFSETGGYQGIGFAVPSNLARHVMDDLLKFGEVQRGTIPGISIANMTTQIAEELGAPNTRGALVNQISRGSRGLPGRAAPRRHHHQLQRPQRRGRVRADAHAGRLEDRHRRAPRDPPRKPPPRSDRADHALTLDARCALATDHTDRTASNPRHPGRNRRAHYFSRRLSSSMTTIRMSRRSATSLTSGLPRVRNPRFASPPVSRKSLIATV